MVMHPVGPLPASTYWYRRAGLLLVLLVLLLVVRSCGGSDGGTPRASSTPSPTVAPTSAPTASTRPTVAPAAAGLCADGALTLTTTTDAETYAVGSRPKITLSIVNSSSALCRRDIGSKAVELLVFSGTDRVWSSDDCATGAAAPPTALPPGAAQSVLKTWPGTRSKPGCEGSQAQAKPGTYRVVARVGTLRVEGAVFRISA